TLQKFCSHEEEYTRGIAALALGAAKVESSFDTLCKMTLDDSSSYARRCAAYALGLMGRAEAKPTLEKALKDSDFNVRNNAEAALTMLSLEAKADSDKTDVQVEKATSEKSTNIPKRHQTILFKKDMSIREALQFLGKAYKKNIIPSDKVNGQIPASELYNVTFEEVLQAILGTHKYIVDGKFIRVYTEEEYNALQIGVKPDVQVEVEKPAVQVEGKAEPLKTIEDRNFNLSIAIPADWQCYKNPNPGKYKFSWQLIPSQLKTWAMFIGGELTDEIVGPVRQIAMGDVAVLKSFFDKYKVRDDSWTDFTISNLPAVRYAADYVFEGKQMVEYRTYILSKSLVYWFVFRIEKDLFEPATPAFDSIVNSFKLKDKTNVQVEAKRRKIMTGDNLIVPGQRVGDFDDKNWKRNFQMVAIQAKF
ncbi:MAG TPA: HEAT repeat domain-containing protein, partial [Desulfosporosinus sp.]|nr:HEAT repeat domain-containing protein [Desulfosporosinus sp.]